MNATAYPDTLKWSRNVKRRLSQGRRQPYSDKRIVLANYRPFTRKWLYRSDLFIDELGYANLIAPDSGESNPTICFTDANAQKPWFVCAVDGITDLHYVGAGAGTVCVSRYRFINGDRIDNITNWTLERFQAHYSSSERPITKDAIFHYVYGVLHDPLYREKFALNLRRGYPHIPFYPEFWRWASWGERLLGLHLGYASVEPWPLRRVDVIDEDSRQAGLRPKAVLRSNKEEGIIRLNGETQLLGVPSEAWQHKLGIRSALEWVLDQYTEGDPKDGVLRDKFNRYKFADHKEQVIDILTRVTRVSVETQRIVERMRDLDRTSH